MSFEELFKRKVPTPEQLHTLVRFVDHGSLPKAFGEGKSAQAAATQQLGRIDRCLGIKTRRSIGSRKVPTEEAQELAGFCREFFQRLVDFKNRTERKPNSFAIGAGDSLMFYLLIPSLAKAKKWSSQVELQLQNLRSHEVVTGLLNGSLDIGLVRTNAVNRRLLQQRKLKMDPICSLEFAFFVRTELLQDINHKLSDDQFVLAWAIGNLPLATFWGERSTFTKALGKSKLKWQTNLRCQSFPQVREAVVSGRYCGILPRVAFQSMDTPPVHSFGLKLLKGISRQVGLVWSSALVDRRLGGEKMLAELKAVLKPK